MPSDFTVQAISIAKSYKIYPSPASRILHRLSGGHLGAVTELTALESLSFPLGRGETLGIIGRNGSGKTTLLRILAGVVAASTGQLKICGHIGSLISLGAGFDLELTGRINIRNWGTLLRDGPFTATEIDSICAFTGIDGALDRPMRTYSQGMLLRHLDAEVRDVL